MENGNITVNSSTKNLTLNIGNGKADARINPSDNCNVSMSVGNGFINLKVPGNTNASVHAGVGNGLVSNSGLSFRESQSSRRNFNGTLGIGSGRRHLSLGNGNIDISKN